MSVNLVKLVPITPNIREIMALAKPKKKTLITQILLEANLSGHCPNKNAIKGIDI